MNPDPEGGGSGPQRISKEEFMRAVFDDIPPENFAGEGFGATDEYFPQDIEDPYMRGKVTGEEEYWPGADRRRKWPPYRGF